MVISENVIWDVKLGFWLYDKDYWLYVYLDEGFVFVMVCDNWCLEEKF